MAVTPRNARFGKQYVLCMNDKPSTPEISKCGVSEVKEFYGLQNSGLKTVKIIDIDFSPQKTLHHLFLTSLIEYRYFCIPSLDFLRKKIMLTHQQHRDGMGSWAGCRLKVRNMNVQRLCAYLSSTHSQATIPSLCVCICQNPYFGMVVAGG